MLRASLLIAFSCLGLSFNDLGNTNYRLHSQEPSGPERRPKAGSVTSKSSPKAPSRLDQQSALMLLQALYDVADRTQQWDDAALAARAQARIADVSWTIDETRATKYLTSAWLTADHIKEPGTNSSPYRNDSLKTEVKSEILFIAKKRMPELAQKWIEEIKAGTKEKEEKTQPGTFDNRTLRSAVLLQSALQSVDSDPQAAADMAIQSLEDGISFDLRSVLVRLQEKDFNLSQRVFSAALARLRTFGMSDPNELLILYAYLFTPNRVSAVNTTDNPNNRVLAMDRSKGNVQPAALLNPPMANEFLSIACDLLLRAPAPSLSSNVQNEARAQISAIQVLLGAVTERLPARAPLLQARLRQLYNDANFQQPSSSLSSKSDRTMNDIREQRIKDLEDQAGREPNKLRRDFLYAKASLATSPDDYERGLGLAGKIDDSELQSKVSNLLIFRSVISLINLGNLVRAQQLNAKNSDPSQRAACMVIAAQHLVRAKNYVQAKRWLQETRSLLLKTEPSEATARIALGMVATYGKFDRTLALESLMDAVMLINKSPDGVKDNDSAPSPDVFAEFRTPSFTGGTSGFGFTATVNAFQLDQLLAVADIFRNIKRPEIGGMLLLTLCRQHQEKIREAVTPSLTGAKLDSLQP